MHRSLFLLIILWAALFALPSFAAIATTRDNENGQNQKEVVLPPFMVLHDGHTMPRVGLGVALTGDKTYEAVQYAIGLGYSLFDTAAEESYGNEDQVGRAMADYYSASNNSDARRKLFVTTKLWDSDHGFFNTLHAFWKSYQTINAGSSHESWIPIDLYLIHSPYGGRLLETWDALVWLKEHDLVTSIGVSNFGIEHLEVLRKANRPMPVVNQIEMHPLVYDQRLELLEYCEKHSIVVQAFGSLMHGYPRFLTHPPRFLAQMAKAYTTNGIQYATYPQKQGGEANQEANDSNNGGTVTVAHILLQWAIQHGLAIIPKSSKNHRIAENVRYLNLLQQQQSQKEDVVDFGLDKENMEVLDRWGSHLPYEDRNIYKEDWNWNPIDEAPLHSGRDDYWPNYEGIPVLSKEQRSSISYLETFFNSLPYEELDEDDYWEEYWEHGIPLVEDDDEDDDDDEEEYAEDEDDEAEFHQEL